MAGAVSALEVSVQDVKRMLDAGEDFVLLDIRQAKEFDTARIAGAVFVPMNELPARLSELQAHAARPIVTHCHHGMRSLQAAAWLRAQGFENVRSMAGGIDEWSVRIDPTVPRY